MENQNLDTSRTVKINNLLAAVIIAISFVVMGISGSYAFFINKVVDENTSETKKVSISSDGLTMNFESSQYISVNNAGLIDDEELLSATPKDGYTEFTISLPGTSNIDTAYYEIFLTDIEMTDNFKSKSVKWALYKVTDGVEPSKQKEGDFDSVLLSATPGEGGRKKANSSLTLNGPLPDSGMPIVKGAADKYRLYIWLSNNPKENQSELLNGSLSAKVGFRAITKAATS